ncbi:MAG TPA: DUF4954 family protein [Sedimentisphaerales bacterium]|nr:DUF4954 family protein [Sedimentisphaerales bacterium]
MAAEFRSLSDAEIQKLADQGCVCSDWSRVQVNDGFNAARVRNTQFSGCVKLGTFDRELTFAGGIKRATGISNANIHNCRIGNNVFINNVRNYLANYIIEDDVIIENVDFVAVDGESSFGNGIEVAVLNEAGGREIPIYDQLSAQSAYVIAFYRHRPIVIDRFRKMIAEYAASVTNTMGLIGQGAAIVNCRFIKNVKIGPKTVIEAAQRLENGSINSCTEDPVYIGAGVDAKDFIVQSGARITEGTILCKCLVGQACRLEKQYSAEQSVFFANCVGHHGEACAIFAGPYTVTHHKSTLLIAGLFSFLNAGSGSNQSNHLYKLGPNHQGIVERGSKTTSDSYILWPAKVGAFTLVMGRHYRHSDTSDLPFSYLIEHEDESVLVPGINLRSVGTIRDARKWPKRDNRKDPQKLDYINFKLLNPYTVQKMLKGCDVLSQLKATSGQTCEYFTYNNVRIKRSSLDKGMDFYQMAAVKFLGNCLIKRLANTQFAGLEELRAALLPDTDVGKGKWVDLGGMLVPAEVVEGMLDRIEKGDISTLEQARASFEAMHERYDQYEWTWAAGILEQISGKSFKTVTADDIAELTTRWKDAVLRLDRMLYDDARKEFAATAQIGYGLDGDEDVKRSDFEHVRGTFEQNSFVIEIQEHMAAKTKLADEVIGRLKNIH